MPEIITKHPEQVVQVLKGMSMDCGSDKTQKEVSGCPSEQFCTSPQGDGEICVYTPSDLGGSMTQLTTLDFIKNNTELYLPCAALAMLIFLTGLLAGFSLRRRIR